jgi:hypothetical protein
MSVDGPGKYGTLDGSQRGRLSGVCSPAVEYTDNWVQTKPCCRLSVSTP